MGSLLHAWHTNPAAVLLAAGAFVLGVALSVFLVASIPAMLVRLASLMLPSAFCLVQGCTLRCCSISVRGEARPNVLLPYPSPLLN